MTRLIEQLVGEGAGKPRSGSTSHQGGAPATFGSAHPSYSGGGPSWDGVVGTMFAATLAHLGTPGTALLLLHHALMLAPP
jgi:hypothetical protein